MSNDPLAKDPSEIKFQGALWRISQDQDGESRVTFSIPVSDLGKVLNLGTYTQQLLEITVRIMPT